MSERQCGEPGKRARRGGRPSLWTPALESAILDTLKTGCSLRDAAEVNGISYETLKARQRTGDKFSALLARARLQFKLRSLGAISAAIDKGNISAAEWWLERVYPDEYGRRQNLSLGGGVEEPVRVAVDVDKEIADRLRATPEGRRRITEDLYRAAGREPPPKAVTESIERYFHH
jgi:hypothetical protein